MINILPNISRINLSFLIKPFSYMNKKERQKFQYPKNKTSFQNETKNIFHQF